MKTIIKLTLLLAFLLPALASAHNFEVDGIYYNIYNNKATVTYKGSSYDSYSNEYSGSVVIPATVAYNGTTCPVTSIGSYAFRGCSGLTSVNIPNSVTSIGEGAFFHCSGLTSVNIPNSVTSISSSTFSGCQGLSSVNIPNSVTSIGNSAFQGCSGLSSVNIPNSVTSIGISAFQGCSGLNSITVASYNPNYDSRGNCNAIIETATNTLIVGSNHTIIPNSVTSIGRYAFWGCSGLTSVNIPNSVTYIGLYAFQGCSGLTSMTIPNSVTYIGLYAFQGCSGLTSVIIPNSVTSIGDGAFQGCTALNTLYFDADSCANFSSTASYQPFYNLNISTINIGNNVQRIPAYFASGLTKLSSITIPNSVTSIGDGAFQGCSGLTSITCKAAMPPTIQNDTFTSSQYSNAKFTVPKGKKSTYQAAYPWLRFTNIYESSDYDFVISGIYYAITGTNPNTVKVTYKDSEYSCYSGSVSIPMMLTRDGTTYVVTEIDGNAFHGCTGLTNVTIPSSVTSIGSYAFYGCSELNSVNIPNSVTSIGDNAFGTCTGLTNITISDSVTTIGSYAFYGCSGLTSVNIPNSVTSIGEGAFYYCSGLTSVNIPNSVTSISNSTFSGCSGLNSVNIPNSVTSIGDNAFGACSGLTNITISGSVTSIGSSAFFGCSGLTSVTIPNSVTSIGDGAFRGCSGLTSVTIPNSVTSMEDNTFKGCSGLTSVTIPNTVTSIGYEAFFGCSRLTSVTIPNSITSIGDGAFRNCYRLESVIIPSSVTFIGHHAFYQCNKLKDVYSYIEDPSTVQVGDEAFNFYVYLDGVTYTLHVPASSKSAYLAINRWSDYFDSIVEMGVTSTSIQIDLNSIELYKGETRQLTATVLPDAASNKNVSWKSNNQSVATVDGTGLVSALSYGTATITATTTDGTNLSASCVVTVIENQISYDNYLSMGDTTVMHGETIVIPVKMTNETSIISFQTDIFLPDGLELMQEDGEFIIDPSERMTRTHSIMSNEISNGAIRVLCYSSNYKPFTGNSGDDLFYITVKVADDAEGDYTIQLKNTLLTNTDFVDLAAPDVAANVNVKAYLLGDANNSGTVTVGDVVATAQYVLEMNPQPFVFEAADVNMDNNITVADVSRIAWMVLNPAMNAPMRAPALWNNGDLMGAEGISLKPGETRRVSITLDNEMDYSAFQLDLKLPSGLTASNFQLTGRASSHAFDVNTLQNGMVRALCYSPLLTAIIGHEGALLTFDVTATGNVSGDIIVDGIELVTTACQSVKLDAFTIGVNDASAVNELANGKAVARVDYFNLAGQQIERPESGVTLVVTTYTDGTRNVSKIFR